MGITIGIDLGTTNSCVAVFADADIPRRDELVDAGRLRAAGHALIVTDSFKSPITPSAIWMDPDGRPVVGILAKHKAAIPGEPPPAMFFKRSMGTDQEFTAGHRRITAQEASTHLLRHLKELAEEVLGVPVERAVVTVPAFFETGAKNATTRAGAEAGLQVVETLLEPVAAALTHVYDKLGTATEPGSFLVYDLGGGTFDASVVTWDPEGDFHHRTFSGDRYLGGYDFDKQIVRWVADELPQYDLDFDDAQDAHVKLFNTLLVDAEHLKIALTTSAVSWFIQQRVSDCAGEPLNINLPMPRDTFHGLVAEQIRGTLDRCADAVERARLPGDLDEVVLVGGSSRIPLVAELLEERFGRRPLSGDLDTCVAIGAALRTAGLVEPSEHLELARPTVVGGTADIAGRVLSGRRLDTAEDRQVQLTSDDGQVRLLARSGGDGAFQFLDVPLDAGENGFTVAVLLDGTVLDSQQLTVLAEAGAAAPPEIDATILTSDFSIGVEGGLHTVVEAGAVVPHSARFTLYTVSRGNVLLVAVYEGLVQIGEVTIEGLSRDLAVGTPIEVRLHFTEDWEIEATALIPSVGRTGSAVLRIHEVEIGSWEQLQLRFDEIRATWQERRALAEPEVRMTRGPAVIRLIAEVEDLLAQRNDSAKATHKLTSLETAVATLPIGQGANLRPTLSAFETDLDALQRACDRMAVAKGEAAAAQYRDRLPGLRDAGMAAYEAGNQQLWSRAVEAAQGLTWAIENELAGPGSAGGMSPDRLRLLLRQAIDEERGGVRMRDREDGGAHRGLAADLLAEGDRLDRMIAEVDPRDVDAQSRLQSIHAGELQRWLADVRAFPPRDVIVLGRRAPR